MKNKLIISGAAVLLLTAIYAFAWFFVLPKSAMVMTPLKWRSVRAGQGRMDYLFYLGDPVSDSTKWLHEGDRWIRRDGNYTFEMDVAYNNDSVGKAVKMQYHFKNWLFDKTGIIVSDTIEE